jgi:hypothetical protein
MEFTEAFKTLFIETAQALKGSARRLFMARTVKEIGPGGQRYAEREFGWNRGLLRKGAHELESGFRCLDAFSARGRKRAEAHLPNLLDDIRAIVDSQSQADPQFRTTRLYTREVISIYASLASSALGHRGLQHFHRSTGFARFCGYFQINRDNLNGCDRS